METSLFGQGLLVHLPRIRYGGGVLQIMGRVMLTGTRVGQWAVLQPAPPFLAGVGASEPLSTLHPAAPPEGLVRTIRFRTALRSVVGGR